MHAVELGGHLCGGAVVAARTAVDRQAAHRIDRDVDVGLDHPGLQAVGDHIDHVDAARGGSGELNHFASPGGGAAAQRILDHTLDFVAGTESGHDRFVLAYGRPGLFKRLDAAVADPSLCRDEQRFAITLAIEVLGSLRCIGGG